MEVGLKLAQSLECPVCLSMFENPKILLCSHSFCKTCLDRLVGCHGEDKRILCPVCRVETKIPNGDVSLLQTNLAVKSLLEDVKSQSQFCSDCPEAKSQAVVYCQECGKYLCVACQGKHSEFDKWSDHEVLDVKEIASGKLSLRKYRKCKKHPREDEECFCADCRRFACFRCIIKEHAHEKHEIMEGSAFAVNHRASVEEWKSQSNEKNTRIRKYIEFIDEQKCCIQNAKKQCLDDIGTAFEESVQQLAAQKESLLQEVVRKNDEAEAALEKLKDTAQQQMAHVTAMTDLVANGTKIPLETEALAAHDSLCQGLQDTLRQENPDYKQARKSSKPGKNITFERNKGTNEFGLGKIVHVMEKFLVLPVRAVSSMAATPDGRMAVGCSTGGIEILSADGHLLQTVLKNVLVKGVGFLHDGRYVVLDEWNIITLYTSVCEKLDVKFETPGVDRFGNGILSVDKNDQIYVSYKTSENVQVFLPSGGKAIQEIPLNRNEQYKIISCNDFYIASNSISVKVIDPAGTVKQEIKKETYYTCCTVTQERKILIAWVRCDGGFVIIKEYRYLPSKELRPVKTLISARELERPVNQKWYHLQEFRSGEIALCTPSKLYIFREQVLVSQN